MRGGLDDALDKLARRDELRRRAAGEATGTPPAVQELVETIAGVVGRNPKLEVTVGVEGAGEPTLLHFFVEDGTVQVTVDPSVASRVSEAGRPRHADIELDPDDAVDTAPAAHAYAEPADHGYPGSGYAEANGSTPPDGSTHGSTQGNSFAQGNGSTQSNGFAGSNGYAEAGQQTRRLSFDDRDRYDPGTGYGTTPYGEPDPYSRPADGYDSTYAERADGRESAFPTADTPAADNPYLSPFAATPPPPVPPQTTRRIRPEHHRAPEEPSAAERGRAAAEQRPAPTPAGPAEPAAEQRGMPRPLPEPIPLQVDSEETDKSARRLAALLRDNPTLLRPSSPD